MKSSGNDMIRIPRMDCVTNSSTSTSSSNLIVKGDEIYTNDITTEMIMVKSYGHRSNDTVYGSIKRENQSAVTFSSSFFFFLLLQMLWMETLAIINVSVDLISFWLPSFQWLCRLSSVTLIGRRIQKMFFISVGFIDWFYAADFFHLVTAAVEITFFHRR